MDQLHRDVLELIRYSLSHPPGAAGFFFPMFRPEQIESLYAIPHEVRERIWKNRSNPAYQALFPAEEEPRS